MKKELHPSTDEIGLRADIFVSQQLSISRSQAKKLIDDGKALLNGAPIKSSDTVTDTISVDQPEVLIKPIALPVLFEDNDVIVIDKPEGLLTHSKGTTNDEFTVADFIAPRTTDESKDRPGIVHRLDRRTSGVIIGAKTSDARVFLQKQFAKRTVQKTYLAIINGTLSPPKQRFEWPIERNPKKPATFRVGPQGKTAVTDAEVLTHTESYSRVQLTPMTGRTHQLRVHLSHAHRPIVGDEIYGGEKAPRLMLHAQSLQLTLPSGENHVFESTLPKEFDAYA